MNKDLVIYLAFWLIDPAFGDTHPFRELLRLCVHTIEYNLQSIQEPTPSIWIKLLYLLYKTEAITKQKIVESTYTCNLDL